MSILGSVARSGVPIASTDAEKRSAGGALPISMSCGAFFGSFACDVR